jgi:hypothetical protein
MDRSDIELLKILRHYLPKYMASNKSSGICGAILGLLTSDILTADERSTLENIIINNRPSGANPFDYFWPKGELKPRIDFLNKLIEKYENNGKRN